MRLTLPLAGTIRARPRFDVCTCVHVFLVSVGWCWVSTKDSSQCTSRVRVCSFFHFRREIKNVELLITEIQECM